ncbi:MAG: energy-coupling factor transporter transmembrane component T [Spirochaetia bacterium]|nr:energy-coupling factor transporter transmembrane component T [Spirochaetia bacterium]
MNPFALQPLSGPLPRLSALAKAVFLICLSISAIRLDLAPLGILFLIILALSRLAGLRIRDSAGAASGLIILLIFSTLARGLFPGDGRVFALESLGASALYALRLGTIFASARLFYASTRVSELGDYLSAGFRFFLRAAIQPDLRKQDPRPAAAPVAGEPQPPPSLVSDPGMMLSLSLVFIPRAFESYRRIREAAECRGFGTGKKRLFSGLSLLQALIFSSIKNSLRTAEAMEARAYSPGRRISLPRLKRADLLLMTSGLILVFLSL